MPNGAQLRQALVVPASQFVDRLGSRLDVMKAKLLELARAMTRDGTVGRADTTEKVGAEASPRSDRP